MSRTYYCNDCLKTIEFQNDEIERIQREVARQLGYELVDHRLELYGSRLPQENEDSG